MEEILKEVFIKELHESGVDRVFYVQNLPKRLLYREVPKMVPRYDRDGYTDGTLVVDPKGGTVEALLEGLEESRNGDGSVVFPMGREAAKIALRQIDAYIAGTLPRDVVIPQRVPYPMDPTNSMSAPKPKSLIPVVELPLREEPVQVSPAASAAPAKPSRTMTDEQKEAARARMAKAREVAKLKKEQQKQAAPEA